MADIVIHGTDQHRWMTKGDSIEAVTQLRNEWNKVIGINRSLKWEDIDDRLRELTKALERY